jgi:hypothetical protein
MSANEKEQRAVQKAERKAAAAAEKDKKDRRYRRNAAIVIVILVVLIVFALVMNSNLFYTKSTALTIGNTKYTPAETNYFFRNTYNNIYQTLNSQLGDYTSMILDTTQPLDQQTYPYGDEEMTWAEYIEQTAKEELRNITVLYDAAVKAGRTLTADEQADLDQEISEIQQYATSSGYSNADKFLTAYFGKGVTLDVYSRMRERVALAAAYAGDIENSFTYSQEELSAYYSEHAAEYDEYYYYNYPITSSDSAFEGLEGDELAAKMHEAAQEIADATTDFDSLTAAIRAYTGEHTVLSIASNPVDNIGETYKDWIIDPARQKNDVAVFDADGVSYVVLFVELCHNDYPLADFRHILVNAVADEDGNYTQEALDIAKEKAEMLLETWRGDPTEENFASIAQLNSEDTGSYSNGGLYTDVVKYQMVPGVNSFLFDEGKTVGDYGIVFGESSAYTGYHVMYYSGQSEQNYCDLLADDAMRSADYENAFKALCEGYEIKEGSGMRFVTAL